MHTAYDPLKEGSIVSRTASTASELRRLAEQATELARQTQAMHGRLKAAHDEPTRRAGYRLDDAAGQLHQVAREITNTIDDLTRIHNRGSCCADWGLCPEHGNTLASSGGRTWCQRAGCRRRWDYDRGSLPCTEPAAYRVRDTTGGETLLCDGHAADAARRLSGAWQTPIAAGRNR